MKLQLTAIVLLIILLSYKSSAQGEFIGPYGGYIQCMIKDNSGRILVGTPFGGIFRTSDFGENWNQIFQDHLNEDVRSLAVNSGGHIFAGTDAHGIFRSIDGGISWQRLINNLVSNLTVISILIKTDGTIFAGTFSGAYRSTNNGSSFNEINNGLNSLSIYCLAYSGNFLLAGTGLAGIFKSSNNGDNWEAANDGINFSNTIVYKIVSTDSKNVGAGFRYAAVDNKIYRSSTSDFNWSLLPSFMGSSITDMIIKNNGNLNVTTRGAIYGSVNNGDNFIQYTNAPQYPYRTIVESASGGVMTGTEGNGTLVTINDWASSEIKVNKMTAVAIAGMSYTNGVINVISKHGPVYESTDFGSSWKDRSLNLQLGFSYDIKRNPVTNTLFASNQNSTFRLEENSNNWVSTGRFSNKIRFNSLGKVFLFSGFSCYRSDDDGLTFPLTSNVGANASDVAFDESDNIYIATANQLGIGVGIKWSNDNGQTFSDINNGLTSLNISAIEYIDLTGITSTCLKKIVAASWDGKFFTKDDNNSWNELSAGLPLNFKPKDIASVNYGTGIINGIIDGQLATNSNSNCIFSLQETIADFTTAVYILTIINANGLLNTPTGFFGTSGSSVLRYDLLATDISEFDNKVPVEFNLFQNYPNPFNPTTKIAWQSRVSSHQTLRVYDVLGNEVATLVDEYRPLGSYEIEFDAKGLASGMYLYRLQAGSYVEMKKMILLK